MSRYEPDPKSLRAHPVPDWFEDAKFGIFVHWSLSCIPAWAPRAGSLVDIVRENPHSFQHLSPYAEWYWNALRIPGSPTAAHHAAVWGNAPYQDFREPFDAMLQRWDPGPVGGSLCEIRRALRRARHEAPRRLLPVADLGAQPTSSAVGGDARRRRRPRGRGACARHALRRLLLGRARLDLRAAADPRHRRRQRSRAARSRLRALHRCALSRADRARAARACSGTTSRIRRTTARCGA